MNEHPADYDAPRKPGPCAETDCYCRCTWARGGLCPACLHDVIPAEDCACPREWVTSGGGCQCPIPPEETEGAR